MTASRVLFSTKRAVADGRGTRIEPGTEEWAREWRIVFQSIATGALVHPERVQELLEGGLRHRPWELLDDPNGQPFASFESFCACPRPHGLGLPTAFYGYSWRGLARRLLIA